jgi:predicted nucleotidyltransferase
MSASLSRPDPAQDPVLQRFAASVRALYGARLDRILLFGSRARGDARADSDYDVAVFLRGTIDWWAEVQRLCRIGDALLWDSGAVISAKPFSTDEFADRTLLMGEIRREGVPL